MEFFNKKEEVLEVKLTPFGKYKFSKGLLKPSFYAFFDEGVIYNSELAGFVEKQNAVESRIQDDTPSLKALNVFTGIQTSQSSSAAIIRDAINTGDLVSDEPLYMDPGAVWNREELQYPQDRAAFLSRPLGSSKLSANKQPAWKINARQGEISSSAPQFSSSAGIEKIPQLNINIDYNTYVENVGGLAVEGELEGDFALTTTYDANSLEAITSQIFDSMRIVVDGKNLVLEVVEEHTNFQKENFDIEVFLSSSNLPGGLKQLYFSNDLEAEYTTDDVEYYLTINNDNEINTDLMKKLHIQDFVALGSATGSGVVSTRQYFIKNVYEPERNT